MSRWLRLCEATKAYNIELTLSFHFLFQIEETIERANLELGIDLWFTDEEFG